MEKVKPSIAVVGAGAWGSALALHLARKGNDVALWGRGALDSSLRDLKIGGVSYLLPPNLVITSDLKRVATPTIGVIALPASAWSSILPEIKAQVLVSGTKGLEPTSHLTPLSFAQKNCGYTNEQCIVLSGPSFAADLAAGRPLSLVAGSHSVTLAQEIAEQFSSAQVRVYHSTDPLGVELGGIIKNVVAIAAGVCDALNFGPSARAALISRGLAEMVRLATVMGAQPQTLTGLSGLGDLIMTATDDQSRNRLVGLRLGKGESLFSIVNSIGSTAEGVKTAPLLRTVAGQLSIDAPITSAVVQLLEGSLTPQQLVDGLMNRPLKREF